MGLFSSAVKPKLAIFFSFTLPQAELEHIKLHMPTRSWHCWRLGEN
jgi:hypothetical protein